ncbi:unnamed protein product [Ectocarpus sp. 12 AP-2014]
MGHFQVRVVAASEISEPDWSRLTCNLNINAIAGSGSGTESALPYVAVSLGKYTVRSSAQEAQPDSLGTLRASWPRGTLSVEVMKGGIRPGELPRLAVQVYNQDSIVQSVLSSAVSTVMGSRGSLLGAGELDVSSLLSGGAHLIDTWVELEPKGRVHVHVEYEPKGIQPEKNDVVFLESFARWGDSLVIPPGVPMVVLDRKPPFLLVAFDTFTGREGRLRLHRNTVSVVERLSWLDVSLAMLARPVGWCFGKRLLAPRHDHPGRELGPMNLRESSNATLSTPPRRDDLISHMGLMLEYDYVSCSPCPLPLPDSCFTASRCRHPCLPLQLPTPNTSPL